MIWDQIITKMEADEQAKTATSNRARKRSKKTIKKYHLNADNPNDYLTEREKECMDHLILGRTIKETAKLMKLSPRTVEFYLKNIRQRWGCKSKGKIIEKIQRKYHMSSSFEPK